ncbi:MAG: hypothetical protein ACLRMZ_24220 [Blautia marasmi]
METAEVHVDKEYIPKRKGNHKEDRDYSILFQGLSWQKGSSEDIQFTGMFFKDQGWNGQKASLVLQSGADRSANGYFSSK